jgi:hypothetical protein
MKETFNYITNNYTYLDSNEISNITTTTSLTGVSSSNSGYITLNNPITHTGTDFITIQGNTTAGINTNIIVDSLNIKQSFIKNILDRVIEIRSLTKKSFYEFFDIKKIQYFKNKTKIVCSKVIDLEYIDELKNESSLLIECIDVPFDDYKQKAIKRSSSDYSNIFGNTAIWTTSGTNTITISNPNINLNNDNITWIYNTNNITYTA